MDTEEKFNPNFDDGINIRFELFKEELIHWADTRFKHYFDSNNQLIDDNKYSEYLWNYISVDITKEGGKNVCGFGFREKMPFDKDVRHFFYEVFIKHFPGNHGMLMSNLYIF